MGKMGGEGAGQQGPDRLGLAGVRATVHVGNRLRACGPGWCRRCQQCVDDDVSGCDYGLHAVCICGRPCSTRPAAPRPHVVPVPPGARAARHSNADVTIVARSLSLFRGAVNTHPSDMIKQQVTPHTTHHRRTIHRMP